MKKSSSPKKKPPTSKARPKSAATRQSRSANKMPSETLALLLPTQFERDTMITPEWVAESVVADAERFLNANLPADYVERLAAKAYYLYPRHKHFHKGMNRPGNQGRDTLYMYMRHWTAAWLRRDHYALHKKLPHTFGNGLPLPV